LLALHDQLQSVCIDTLEGHPAAKPVARGWVRALSTIAAVAALAVAVVGLLARYVPLENHVVMFAAALSPYLMTAAVLSVVFFLVGRRWVLAIASTAIMVAGVAVELPLFTSEHNDHGETAPLRVMTANIYFGLGDANTLAATAKASADVLAVQELTPESVQRLSAASLDKTFPYHALDARPGASGVGMWSRYPITSSKRIADFELAMVSARIKVEGVQVDPTVLVAHMSGPWPQPIDDWRADMKHMQGTMSELAKSVGAGCAIVAGDFNSTPDMREFRSLLDGGFQDASEQAGAGFNRTYPANSRLNPPVIAIDHVLTFQCAATSAETTALRGSDHLGLISNVEVPLG
jgi:endonuclease/exonuclease/phosphatase (EEP) superfamily protein YafD